MAERKKPKSGRPSNSGLGCLFWIAFLLVVLGLFLFNRELIRRTLDNTKFFDRILSRPPAEAPDTPVSPDESGDASSDGKTGEATPKVESPSAAPAAPTVSPAASPPAGTKAPEDDSITVPAPEEKPVAGPAAKPAPVQKPVETKPKDEETIGKRDRTLWFVRVDDDGVISRAKTVRSLPASDSPLADSLNALLAGPSIQEKQKGLSSLIPEGTKLLSAIVRGDTAYLSFSEEFQFNAYGIEGYAAQLRQIIWTVTEFTNVRTVQILIEGRRVDYLGSEGIWIGGPIGRDSLE